MASPPSSPVTRPLEICMGGDTMLGRQTLVWGDVLPWIAGMHLAPNHGVNPHVRSSTLSDACHAQLALYAFNSKRSTYQNEQADQCFTQLMVHMAIARGQKLRRKTMHAMVRMYCFRKIIGNSKVKFPAKGSPLSNPTVNNLSDSQLHPYSLHANANHNMG
eukprot:1115712-Pelagomonas_calceolata.AAC.4